MELYTNQYKCMNIPTDKAILLWISKELWTAKDFASYQSESITSPLAKGESIAQVVNDVMEGLYPNVIALWYDLESKKVTLAFRKERGGQ